jgi:signal transduction histidine kinase
VVAHTVTAMNVQAGVVTDAYERDPARAWAGLAEVRTLGRGAVTELRATLAVLRTTGTATRAGPLPAELPALVDGFAAAGVRIGLDLDPATGALPAGMQLATYRIVQESLANVLRHAHARRADVRVRLVGDRLTVEVTDDGRGGDGGRAGSGLVRIAERVKGFGGAVAWEPARRAASGSARTSRCRAALEVPHIAW